MPRIKCVVKSKWFLLAMFILAVILVISLLLKLSPNTVLNLYNFEGTALIIQDGETILRAAYGMACDTQNIEHTVYSQFYIASVSKQFTGAAILLLEIDGLLDTSDTLDNFFTGHDNLGDVTVADLLVMRGGFGSYIPWLFDLRNAGEFEKMLSLTNEDIEYHIISNWRGAPLGFYAYSNSDYWLLGRIIEQASGMTYQEFITTRIFEPVGMANSGFAGVHDAVSPHGIPYVYFDGKNVMDAANWPFSFTYATGGLISTVDDLSLWLDAFFGGELFPTYLLDDVVLVGSYNYGWFFESDPIWQHPGNLPGFNAHVLYDRDSGTRIILLSNQYRAVGGLTSITRAVSMVVFDRPIGRGLMPWH